LVGELEFPDQPGPGGAPRRRTSSPTVTTRALLELLAAEVGHPVAIRSVPRLALRALGLVNPMMRELAEVAYQFDEPFILDTSKYESAFGAAGTPLADAVAATVAWYRARSTT
jgi:hypothetical protein